MTRCLSDESGATGPWRGRLVAALVVAAASSHVFGVPVPLAGTPGRRAAAQRVTASRGRSPTPLAAIRGAQPVFRCRLTPKLHAVTVVTELDETTKE